MDEESKHYSDDDDILYVQKINSDNYETQSNQSNLKIRKLETFNNAYSDNESDLNSDYKYKGMR